jgi:DNA polymerase I
MSKSDKFELASSLLDDFTDIKVKELIELRPWMKDKKFILLTKVHEIESYISICIEKGLASLDLETTGLNNRLKPNGEPYIKIVGICISHHPDEGAYIPVAHEDAEEFNVSLKFCLKQLNLLVNNCRLIFHNFKFDGEVLRNHNIIIDDPTRIEDTMIMAALEDASRKSKGLKYLSEALLGRPQLEIGDMGVQSSKKGVVAFQMVPPQKAVYYGGGDGMNTMAVYLYLEDRMNKLDPTKKDGLWIVYLIEKRCLFVTMEMERNYVRIDRKFLEKELLRVNNQMEEMKVSIYRIAGRKFDINSTQQLGAVLFDELNLRYPPKEEKTKTGHYKTNSDVLEKVDTKNPIIHMILGFRSLEKIKGTYIENFLNNADENDEVKFQLNQVRADTGRFSGSGGKGINIDGYCGVNCQNIPVFDPKNKYMVNLRKAIIAREGRLILSIDYSGEELRIAANFSREPKWLNEFLHGTADLHTITGKIITGKDKITKKERGLGKTLNFLTMYGGGAGGFAAQAKIPYHVAKKMLINFFREYSGLDRWIRNECQRCRKRGYSKTAFGRRRPLNEFYDSPDRGIQAKGDRCAINSAIQGTGSDIIKIALYKVYSWIRKNNLQDDIRILLPVHDEIVYEIKEDKLDAIVPDLCKIMKMRETTDGLGWPVPLEVDAEYGRSFHVDHDFWKERNINNNEYDVKKEDINKKEEFNQENIISTGNFEKDRQKEELIDEETNKSSLTKFNIEDRFDSNGYFCYVSDFNPVVINHFKHVFEILSSYGDSLFTGPKYKISLIDDEGIVYWKTNEKYSLDAFLALCQEHNI